MIYVSTLHLRLIYSTFPLQIDGQCIDFGDEPFICPRKRSINCKRSNRKSDRKKSNELIKRHRQRKAWRVCVSACLVRPNERAEKKSNDECLVPEKMHEKEKLFFEPSHACNVKFPFDLLVCAGALFTDGRWNTVGPNRSVRRLKAIGRNWAWSWKSWPRSHSDNA